MSDPTNPGPFGPQPEYPVAPPTAPAPPASPWAATGAFSAGSPPPPMPPYPSQTTTVTTGGGGAKAAVGIGAALLVGGLGFLGYSLLKGDDAGAASPAEAGQHLFDAIGENDVLGELESLPPGERELFIDISQDATSEARRLGFLSDRFHLDGVQGLQIEADGIEIDPDDDVDTITDGDGPDDGLAVVTVSHGTLRVHLDGDALQGLLGDTTNDLADATDSDLDVGDDPEPVDLSDDPFPIAVVERGGRWFPSLIATSVLESNGSFDDLDIDLANPDVDPRGEDGPEAAVQALLDAATNGDARAAIAVLDPAEAGLFQAAADSFGIPDSSDDTGVDAELTSAEVDDLGGGVHRVVPTGFDLHAEEDDGTLDLTLDDGCWRVHVVPPSDSDSDEIDEETCGLDGAVDNMRDALENALGEDVDVPDELGDILDAFQPVRMGVITVDRGGRTFVSPVRTAADSLLALVRGVEPEDVQDGGILLRLFTGDLGDEFADFGDQVGEALDEAFFGTSGDFTEVPLPPDFPPSTDFPPIPTDPTDQLPTFDPTGASGPNGELELGDVVTGTVEQDGTATFTIIGVEGDVLIGVQGETGFDAVIDIRDEATGELVDGGEDVDDTFGLDPEAQVTLQDGQRVVVEVHGFAGQPGEFNVYYQPVP